MRTVLGQVTITKRQFGRDSLPDGLPVSIQYAGPENQRHERLTVTAEAIRSQYGDMASRPKEGWP